MVRYPCIPCTLSLGGARNSKYVGGQLSGESWLFQSGLHGEGHHPLADDQTCSEQLHETNARERRVDIGEDKGD